ncbi:MAG: bifunctional (p)ppGpp synthetase/guanosine-3',5'-bis(diphosphate) 3'-pyrophosphohydrolase [Anaerolineales bacterium]|nr:bifunctional (p)ppGpp synthetase/guanosine-3',5'-bis(diphosphate) 3'-pyrophosphohydrolase [Anaerolineales bacterium]
MPLIMATPKQLRQRLRTYLSEEDYARVDKAYEFARQKHGNVRRQSGELFFTHPLTVAYYLAKYDLDASAISAALLHDVAEDTSVSIAEIEARFGPEVARIVDGVTKLKDVSEGVAKGRVLTRKEIQDRSNQKMLREMTSDVRVVLVKLFDRLHNMRTIGFMSQESQERKARETLEVFAPLANRLGIWNIKSELEARSMAILYPGPYKIIKKSLKEIRTEHQEFFHLVSGQIFELLKDADLDVRKVGHAPENVYTVFQDIKTNDTGYQGIDRTLRLVVLMEDWISCYTALGHLHQIWRAVPDRFDDYISVPRENLYRSLHTTVVHNSGTLIKIRLRTVVMDRVSKIGVLGRWALDADTPLWDKEIASRIDSFLENTKENINADHRDAADSLMSVLGDQLSKQIHVYTPRGDSIELAKGSSPIDFAYAIHSDLGDQCREAFVNDNLFPLNKPLREGDTVRVLKGANAQPQRAWLDEDLGYLRTNYARSRARRWFRKLPEATAVAEGHDLLQTELHMLGLSNHPHIKVAQAFGYDTTEELYHALGRAELLVTHVATRVLDEKWTEEPTRDLDNVVVAPNGEKYIITHAGGRPLRLCATCEPRPRDNIVGYLRKNGWVTVHREGCNNLRANRHQRRLLRLGWGEDIMRKARLVGVQVDVYDRPGLLFDITNLMREEEINIPYIHTPPTHQNGEVRIIMHLELERARQTVRVLHQIQALVNVYSVQCLPAAQVQEDDQDKNGRVFYKPE